MDPRVDGGTDAVWDWQAVLADRAFWAAYYWLRREKSAAPEARDWFAPSTEVGGLDGYDDERTEIRDGSLLLAGSDGVFGRAADEAVGGVQHRLFNFEARDLETRLYLLDKAGGDPGAAARRLLGAGADAEQLARTEQEFAAAAARRGALPANRSLHLPFPGAYVWQIEFTPSPGINHVLHHPEMAEPLLLGYDDPHGALPILRWQEVNLLRRCLERQWNGAFPVAYAPLLLNATAWVCEGDDPGAIARQLADDWLRSGLLDATASEQLARETTARSPVQWRHDAALGWVNNGEHSRRNPDGSQGRAWRERGGFEQFARFLGVVTEHAGP